MKRILLALLITSLTLFGAFFVTSCGSDSSGESSSQIKTSISSSVSKTSSETDGEQGNSSSSSSSFSQSLSETDSEQSKSSSSSSSKKEDSSQGHVHQMQHVARVEATGSTSGNVEYYHCVSCGKNFKDKNGTTEITDVVIPATRKITFKTLTVDENNNVYGKVPNSQTTYSFLTEVSTPHNVSYIVSLDIYGIQQVPTKTVLINVGDNVFYITETVGNDITLYTVTIRRRPVYTVKFNTNCSTVVENQLVEEDFFAIEPKLEKIGYTFLGWNYSFQNPITSDIQITASWSANTDTKYKVEYYLQNLKDDYYTLYETYNFSGTTDTTATAKQLGYEHFSFNYDNSLTSGNIDGDGSLVLKLYYTRNSYVLSNENTEYGEITNGNTIKYGASVTTCATEYLGCEFVGWYSGEQLLSTNKNYAFVIDKNVTAKFKPKQETSNFIFTADKTTFKITGIKDKTVTQIIIPDYTTSIGESSFSGCNRLTSIIIPNTVTSIGEGAFSSCSSLEEITIPFVGAVAGKTSLDTYQYPFGYIFGTSRYTGGTKTKQYYYGSSTSSTTSSTYYIPTSLKKVTVTGGNILYGAFYNCSSLTSVTIPDSVTSIGSSAFSDCSSLKNIYYAGDINGWVQIDGLKYLMFYSNSTRKLLYIQGTLLTKANITANITVIPSYAFYNCGNLTSLTIPDSVTSIGNSAFSNCSSLTSVTIGNSVTSIESSAFYGCSSLTSITIPDSVTSIGNYAFSGCTAEIKWGDNPTITNIGEYAFRDYKGTSITIPNSVTSIELGAFFGCSSLTSITIPDSVTSIGDVFSGCDNLENIYYTGDINSWVQIYCLDNLMSEGKSTKNLYIQGKLLTEANITTATKISTSAFSGCSSLISITIGNSVTSIGESSFSGCSSLEEITIPFVGGVAGKTSSDTYQYPFGYIFGTSSYTGGTETKQYYYGSSTSSTTSSTYYIPTSLKKVTVTGGNILYGAFYNCSSLYSITIPDSVSSIGSRAFYNCSSLYGLTISNSVTSIGIYAFSGCTAEIKWGDNPTITNIGEYAFGGYKGTSITIPNSITSIGIYAFRSCTAEIKWGDNPTITNIGEYAFGYAGTSITIPNSITSIGIYAFLSCTAEIKWGDNPTITNIGEYAFHGYAGTSITIPNSVTSIGTSAFYGCSRLTSITIPNSVTSIGAWAFKYCSSLTSITIGNSVTSIGSSAFYNCSRLTSITIGNSVTSIGNSAFYGCDNLENIYYTGDINGWVQIDGLHYLMYYGKSTMNLYIQGKLLTELTEANITTATKISSDAFSGCSSLISITIGNSVTSIGSNAFFGCSSLTSITIPDSVTSIGNSAFSGCSSLEEITIPFVGAVAGKTSSNTDQYPFGYIFGGSNYTGGTKTEQYYYGSSTSSTTSSTYYIPTSLKKVTVTGGNILYGAFYNCSNLTSVTIGNSVTSIGESAFSGCSSLVYNEYENGLYLGNEQNKYLVLIKTESTSITSCTINENCKFIYGYAFYNCGNLTSLTIPDSVTSIGSYAFYGCSSLTSITIGNSVTSIGEYAFSGCSSLENIYYTGDINSWVQIDGLEYLMQYGKSTKNLYIQGKLLTEANITANITKIPNYAFYGCSSLTSVTIGNSVTSIGIYAFGGCSSLTSVTIPDSVTSIGNYAFYVCSSLENIYYTGDINGWVEIGGLEYLMEYGKSTKNLYIQGKLLTEANITANITKIPNYAFYGCSSLTSVTIGNSVTSIGIYAFRGCISLTSVTIGNSVTSIEAGAFSDCTSLTSITIPNSVTSIEDSAFFGCSRLETIYYKGTQAEWKKISIGKNNSYLTNANIIYV